MSTRQDKSLHDACGKGHLRKVREILQSNGDIANRLDLRIGFLGYTPLHEAACQGHDDILQLLLIYGGNVDALANGNYTPLHIAASMDYIKCIKVLLKNGADIKALDDFTKTPYQTAIQHKRRESAKCLKSAEIIKAAGNNPQELNTLLAETATMDITASCFDDALIEACHRGKFKAVGMLLKAGAKKIKESICIAIRNGYYRISALLLLCYAALSGDVLALETLLDQSMDCYEWLQQFVDKAVPMGTVVEKIRESLKNVEDYTSIAIQLPGLGNPVTVLRHLLFSTSCRVEEKKVNWSALSLSKIDESWLVQIKSWVQNLNLSHNKLTSLPDTLIDLKMVVSLNLSKNRLKVVPSEIFSLFSLRDLNLSGNAIAELPDIPQWRPVLKSFNVGDNNLSLLPDSISRSCIETLNLSRNHFSRVPLSVCEITSLCSLDLSDNREINELPVEMGKLRNLSHISLKNLDQITDPPEQVRQNAEDLVTTLRRKLRNCEGYYTMKLMLVGKGGQGKTTLVHRLKDDFTFKENDLTQGVDISDLTIQKGRFYREFTFKVWDFGGQEDYYATHQCFLSTMSLYLLVWRLIDGQEGVASLTPWLDNIAVRSPGSTVIIVGTHLDCIAPEKYGTEYVTHMKQNIRELLEKSRYREKVIVPPGAICAVSCAFGGSRTEVNSLRNLIYETAANLKKGRTCVMGELIPSSFISLIRCIEERKAKIQNERELPIIRKEEFDAMVKENSLHCRRDIQEPMDVRDATVFLRERGIVMHFDDPNEGLSDLYFIEPRWLCALMARVITVRSHADLVKDGVLEIQETKVLFHREDLPFEFYDQYIRLLVRFQIVYLLDESRILVPSKLPEKEPEVVTNLQLPYAPVRRVYKIDYQRIHGFWSRFMSRFFFYVKEMIAVDATRYQKAKDSEHSFFGHFCRSCLRVDGAGTRTFPCFMDSAVWETEGKSEEQRRTSRGTSDECSASSSSSKKSSTSQNTPTETKNDPSINAQSKQNVTQKGPSRKNLSKKALWRKDPSRKDPSRKDPSKKDPSKKDPSRKESSKKKSRKKDLPRKDPSDPSRSNDFLYTASSGNLRADDEFQALLLDPNVKLFSDDELRDDTDGQDRIVINDVDTAMDYTHRSASFFDKKKESVKRVALSDLRIPSYDGSLPTNRGIMSRGSPRSSQKSTTSNGEEGNPDVTGKDDRSRNMSEKDEMNGDNPRDEAVGPNPTEDGPNTTEDCANSPEDVPMENADNATGSAQNTAGNEDRPIHNEDRPIHNEGRPTSEQIHPEEIPTGNTGQGSFIEEDDCIDNNGSIEDVSEATDSEYSRSEETKEGGIKIPTVGSVDLCPSDENLSCSDLESISSWKQSKGLPIMTPVTGSFLESESFSEKNMNESFDDNNAQFAAASVSSDGSHTSYNGHDFGFNSQPYNRATSRGRTVSSEVETHEVSRNSVSQSETTASSVRSDPTDTDCEVFSESISSVSTTNDNEHVSLVDHRPNVFPGTQFQPSYSLNSQTSPEPQEKAGQTKVGERQFSHLMPNFSDDTEIPGKFPSKDDFESCKTFANETSTNNYSSAEISKLTTNHITDCETEAFENGKVDQGTEQGLDKEGKQAKLKGVFDGQGCDDIDGDVTGHKVHGDANNNGSQLWSHMDNTTVTDESLVVNLNSEARNSNKDVGLTDLVYSHNVPLSPTDTLPVASSESIGAQSVGEQTENVGLQSGHVGLHSQSVGTQRESDGEHPGSDGEQPESVDLESESVETKKCTLCKENVAVDQLVTVPLDVAELIEQKFLHCWRTGVCFAHPEAFLVVSYRTLSDSIVVEIAVSPNPLGRRLLTFVVDHLDTLIKEWYPGLLMSFGPHPTVQKLIPCRICEKDGNPRPHMFTFDSCVTQCSMGICVKCPEHEVSIQDIAPDVVLQDIDADLLLTEDELEYERSDANVIGKGGFGKVYRGRCRDMDAAIKEYSSPECEKDAMKRYCEVRNEVNILRRLGQHPFLVNLIGVCLRPFRLVLELAMEGSLAKTLFNPQFLIERVVMYRMLYQIADALSFLHVLKVIYRDLKPHNVLVMSYEEGHDVNIKLTDFGTAAFQFNEGLIDIVGSVGYNAPEMLREFSKKTGYDEKVDVFALAMVIYGFITRRKPFFHVKSSAEVNNMIVAGRRPEYDDVIQSRIGFAGLTWLMNNCLSWEPSMRNNSTNIAEQLCSTSFQLFLGLLPLPCPQSVRHVCLVQTTMELWVAVDDKAKTMVFVYDLKNWCLKKTFTINRVGGDSVLCLQVNCMHVAATEVLIGLRGDLDIVAIYDSQSYKLKYKITLEEPVFSLSSNEFFIFMGMSSGVCLVTSRTKTILSFEVSHSEPVTCVSVVGDYLWLTAGKCIQIFHVEEQEKTPVFDLNAVRFSASLAPFSQTVLAVDEANIWCISKGDSVVTAWNANTRQKTLEIDCKSILTRLFSEDGTCDALDAAVTCVLPVLDTVWIGTGGGKLLIVDVTSGELITSLKLYDDHVRTLTLVPGPGPCGTEKYYVVVSGRKIQETALSRDTLGKHVCRINNDVIRHAHDITPDVQQPSPAKPVEKPRNVSRKSPFGRSKTPLSDARMTDVQDAAVNYAQRSVLMFFEALPAQVLRRTESK